MSVTKYSTSPDSNVSVGDGGGSVSIAEGMPRGDVNNAMRAIAADMAKDYRDQGGIVSAGTGVALTLATASDIPALGGGMRFTFEAHITVEEGATLNVNGIGPRGLLSPSISGLSPVQFGDFAPGYFVQVIYNGTDFVIANKSESVPDTALPLVRLHVSDGQSNALAKYSDDADGNEPLDRQTADVIVQNGADLSWVSAASWKAAPFAGVGAPHGSDLAGGAPNIGLSFAQRFNAHYGGKDYLVNNARSGRSIEKWIDTVTGTPMYDEIKAKIEAALATPELTGVSTVTTIVRTQSEEDFNHVSAAGADGPGEPDFPYMPFVDTVDFKNNTAIYQAYYWALDKYVARLKNETWWGPDSVLILNSGSELHRRYMPIRAMQDFAASTENVEFVDCSIMQARTDLSDFTHFDGPSQDTIGYYLDFAAYQNAGRSDGSNVSFGSVFSNRVGEPYRRGDDTIVLPTDTVIDASFEKLAVARGNNLTIAGGAITVVGGYHGLQSEGGAASDTLSVINGGTDGMFLTLRANSSSQDITFENKTASGGDRINMLGDASKTTATNRGRIFLQYDDSLSEWFEIAFNAD